MTFVSTRKDDTIRARKKSVKSHGSNKKDTTQGTDDNIDKLKKVNHWHVKKKKKLRVKT